MEKYVHTSQEYDTKKRGKFLLYQLQHVTATRRHTTFGDQFVTHNITLRCKTPRDTQYFYLQEHLNQIKSNLASIKEERGGRK